MRPKRSDSVVVITFALHAKGLGFKPRSEHFLFELPVSQKKGEGWEQEPEEEAFFLEKSNGRRSTSFP